MNTIKFGVPGSLLKDLISDADIPCTDEGEALAMACGAWFTGKKPIVYMQNSGLGNCVDIISSLYKPYGIPLPEIIIGLRHEPEHHRFMGGITIGLLELLGYDAEKVTIVEKNK